MALYGQILFANPRPPSELRRELDPRLNEIVLRAMEKKPENRYASMSDLAEQLGEYLRQSRATPGDNSPPEVDDFQLWEKAVDAEQASAQQGLHPTPGAENDQRTDEEQKRLVALPSNNAGVGSHEQSPPEIQANCADLPSSPTEMRERLLHDPDHVLLREKYLAARTTRFQEKDAKYAAARLSTIIRIKQLVHCVGLFIMGCIGILIGSAVLSAFGYTYDPTFYRRISNDVHREQISDGYYLVTVLIGPRFADTLHWACWLSAGTIIGLLLIAISTRINRHVLVLLCCFLGVTLIAFAVSGALTRYSLRQAEAVLERRIRDLKAPNQYPFSGTEREKQERRLRYYEHMVTESRRTVRTVGSEPHIDIPFRRREVSAVPTAVYDLLLVAVLAIPGVLGGGIVLRDGSKLTHVVLFGMVAITLGVVFSSLFLVYGNWSGALWAFITLIFPGLYFIVLLELLRRQFHTAEEASDQWGLLGPLPASAYRLELHDARRRYLGES